MTAEEFAEKRDTLAGTLHAIVVLLENDSAIALSALGVVSASIIATQAKNKDCLREVLAAFHESLDEAVAYNRIVVEHQNEKS